MPRADRVEEGEVSVLAGSMSDPISFICPAMLSVHWFLSSSRNVPKVIVRLDARWRNVPKIMFRLDAR